MSHKVIFWKWIIVGSWLSSRSNDWHHAEACSHKIFCSLMLHIMLHLPSRHTRSVHYWGFQSEAVLIIHVSLQRTMIVSFFVFFNCPATVGSFWAHLSSHCSEALSFCVTFATSTKEVCFYCNFSVCFSSFSWLHKNCWTSYFETWRKIGFDTRKNSLTFNTVMDQRGQTRNLSLSLTLRVLFFGNFHWFPREYFMHLYKNEQAYLGDWYLRVWCLCSFIEFQATVCLGWARCSTECHAGSMCYWKNRENHRVRMYLVRTEAARSGGNRQKGKRMSGEQRGLNKMRTKGCSHEDTDWRSRGERKLRWEIEKQRGIENDGLWQIQTFLSVVHLFLMTVLFVLSPLVPDDLSIMW